MKKIDYLVRSFLSAGGVLVYVAGIAWTIKKGGQLFPDESNIIVPIFMLLLLVISAAVTGTLVLGWPVHLYLSNQKKAAIIALISNIVWLIIFASALMMIFRSMA